MSLPGARTAKVTLFPSQKPDLELRNALMKISKEKFSRSDLLRARKIAHERGLHFLNDYDAVRLLRKQGLDFQPTVPKSASLPPLAPAVQDQPGTERSKAALKQLCRRLGLFVAVPTTCAAIYYGAIASPVYATYSEFVIQKPEPAAGSQSTQNNSLSGNQDAISVQGFMMSRAAFEAMDQMERFREHFSDPSVDFLQRLPKDASSEQAYRAFQRHVDVAFDPMEGVLRMRVEAMDPQVSRDISLTLISLAEEHLDRMTEHLRHDQVESAILARDRAEADVEEIQNLLIQRQEEFSVLSGDLEMGIIQEQISKLESELTDAMMEHQELMFNLRPNQARIDNVESRIALLQESIDQKRSRIAQANKSGVSIARAQSELTILEAELASRQEVKKESILALERARIEASRQARYLSLGVEPTLPGSPEGPRPLISTLKAFAVFLGLYLFCSLTISLIREHILKE
jgi:capsular polysaccharide transport system permease protein